MPAFPRLSAFLIQTLSLALLIHVLALPENASAEELKGDLDFLLDLPSAYNLTPADLEERFPQGDWKRNPYFTWLTEDKSRAIFQTKRLDDLTVLFTLGGGTVPLEEAIVDFKDGIFLGTTISIYNRGDGGTISQADFKQRFSTMGKHLGTVLAARPVRRDAKPTVGLLTSGFIWVSARGKAVLEHNPEADQNNVEFLRLRLAKREAGGAYEAATQAKPGATVTLSQLPANVKTHSSGATYIDGIPMVDQGNKGYCTVAATQRLFEYYGIVCDMHQLAQIAGSDPEKGTSSLTINEELGAIDHLFKTRFECLALRHSTGLVELVDNQYVGDPVPENRFFGFIEKYVKEGIPLLWSLEVGVYPEDPPLKNQSGGGHMRMIIGFDEANQKIVFSDSWGSGHEFKTMAKDDVFKATTGLFVMKPTVR
jgi:Peptidase_C39 like family